MAVRRMLAAACVLIVASPLSVIAQTRIDDPLLARGEYLLRISGCSHCHTSEDGEHLAGGRALETPFGTFYTPNITSHKSAGIGAWNNDEFERAPPGGVAGWQRLLPGISLHVLYTIVGRGRTRVAHLHPVAARIRASQPRP